MNTTVTKRKEECQWLYTGEYLVLFADFDTLKTLTGISRTKIKITVVKLMKNYGVQIIETVALSTQ